MGGASKVSDIDSPQGCSSLVQLAMAATGLVCRMGHHTRLNFIELGGVALPKHYRVQNSHAFKPVSLGLFDAFSSGLSRTVF